MSNSVRPHRRQPTRLPHPWDSLGKNTGVGCHFLLQCMKVKSQSEVAQSCLTLSDPMDCSLPGSSVHGIFQARVLAWGAIVLSEAISNCPLLFPSSILDTFWPGGCHIFLFSFSYCSWGSHGKKTDIVCHSRLQLTVFCQNSLPWSVHLEWLCMAWLIASLSYASPFTTTNYDLWRGLSLYKYVHFNSKSNSGTVRN